MRRMERMMARRGANSDVEANYSSDDMWDEDTDIGTSHAPDNASDKDTDIEGSHTSDSISDEDIVEGRISLGSLYGGSHRSLQRNGIAPRNESRGLLSQMSMERELFIAMASGLQFPT